MKITKRNRQTITNSCQVSECDKLKDDENISIQSACAVEGMTEEDVNMSDWSNEEICEFIKNYFDNITGYPISVVYDRIDEVDENSPLFEQLGIEDAAESISDFLSNHTDWDEEKVDQFYYVLEDDLFMDNEKNKTVTSACDVNSGSELDYMLNGSDQYAVEQALDMLRSGDEDDIETVVRYAVNVVNNGNAEPEYEDEDFYQEEADYDTVLRAVKAKLGRGIKSSCEVTSSSEMDEREAVQDWVVDKVIDDYNLQEYMVEDLGIDDIDSIYNVDYQDLLDWIYTNDDLYEEFELTFPNAAKLHEEGVSEYSKVKDSDTTNGEELKSSKDVMCETDINRADYLDDLCEEIDKYIDEQGYSSVVSMTDGYYITVQLFDFNEEDFETEDSLHTAVFDIDEIDENEDIYDVAEQLGQSVIDEYESIDFSDDRYEEKETKQVVDSDGFMTDYTMYYDRNEDKYIFMLGDKDAYGPDDNYADWECDSEQEAYEWFESYDGFVDEEY